MGHIKNKRQSRIANEIKHNRWNAENSLFRIKAIKDSLYQMIEGGMDGSYKVHLLSEELKKARYDFNATSSRVRELKKLAKKANKEYAARVYGT